LPSRFKYRNGPRKYILKQALKGIVPDFVLDRPKKGFGIPLQSWLRGIDVSTPPAVPGGIDAQHMQALADRQRSGSADNRLAVWSWLAYRSYLEQRDAA
jgi:asparagine synthase (glutamine-hydrolysing)